MFNNWSYYIFFMKKFILLFIILCITFQANANNVVESQVQLSYKTDFTADHIIESVYTRPYNAFDNNIEYSYIKTSMLVMAGASVLGAGILYLLPESFTNWDKDDASDIFSKWKNNVTEGPVMDEDDFFLNYVTHPYWGAVYYMSARSAGANVFYSFLYSAILSTFFWEYGVEAFAEVPSKQDLIITPVVGSMFGELFYLSKRRIINNDYQLLGSRTLGKITIFIMDPITEVTKFFLREDKDDLEENKDIALYSFPTIDSHGAFGYNISFSYKF